MCLDTHFVSIISKKSLPWKGGGNFPFHILPQSVLCSLLNIVPTYLLRPGFFYLRSVASLTRKCPPSTFCSNHLHSPARFFFELGLIPLPRKCPSNTFCPPPRFIFLCLIASHARKILRANCAPGFFFSVDAHDTVLITL